MGFAIFFIDSSYFQILNAYYIILPCYNENTTAVVLIKQIKEVVTTIAHAVFTVIVVDDCSTDNTNELINQAKVELESENFRIDVVRLAVNQGHQNAIYNGLHYCNSNYQGHVIVMDSDGEDDPQAIKSLVEQAVHYDAVLVKRGKRNEKIPFLAGYFLYKLFFKILTGAQISFGNYSIISPKVLALIMSKNGFIHYAAMLSRLKVSKTYVLSDRRKRIDGKSKMSYNNLILHGVKSFVEYSEEILITMLKFFAVLMVLFLFSIVWVLYEKLFTNNAIPGWAGTLSLMLLIASLLSLGFFVMGIFLLKISSSQRGITLNYQKK